MNACLIRAFLFFIILASAKARPIALVGGRLIDGFGGHPLANSVIIIENERVTAISTVGALDVPPDAELISTEGMDVLPKLQRRDPQAANPPAPDSIIKAEVLRKRDHVYQPHKVE